MTHLLKKTITELPEHLSSARLSVSRIEHGVINLSTDVSAQGEWVFVAIEIEDFSSFEYWEDMLLEDIPKYDHFLLSLNSPILGNKEVALGRGKHWGE